MGFFRYVLCANFIFLPLFPVVVTSVAELNSAIIAANGGGDANIQFGSNINTAQRIFPFNSSSFFSPTTPTYGINGQGFVLENTNSALSGAFGGFFARGNLGANTITIQDLTIRGTTALGGFGASQSGGGGLGAGGGIFVGNGATVVLDNVSFENCRAVGGTGSVLGSAASGGGGGCNGGASGGTGGVAIPAAGSFNDTTGGGGGGGFIGRGGGSGLPFATDPCGGGGGGGFAIDPTTGGRGGGGTYIGNPPGVAAGGGGGGGGFNGERQLISYSGGGGAGDAQSGQLDGTGGAGSASVGGAPGSTGSGDAGGGGGAGGVLTVAGQAGESNATGRGGSGPGGGGGGASTNSLPRPDSPFGGDGGVGFGGGGGAPSSTNLTNGPGGNGGFGGGGGGGGGDGTANGGILGNGGNGGAYAGGGGGGLCNTLNIAEVAAGGDGGFGGGGGSGGATNGGLIGAGGNGGFGGGGGGGGSSSFGVSAFAGGNGGNNGGGGGGAGLGGTIFIENGGSLQIQTAISITGSSVTGGSGANNGQALGQDIFMMSGGSILVTNLTSDSSIPSPIAGNVGVGGGDANAGGLTLDSGNTARFTLNGANTYSGVTTVNSGELYVEGSVITPVVVTGGVFGGNASLVVDGSITNSGNLTVSGTGRVSPGGDGVFGDIVVGNALVFTSGTEFVSTEVDSVANSDRITVTGTADLGSATLNVTQATGNFIQGQTITILSATGGLGGTEFTVGTMPLLLNGGPLFEVVYTATEVQLVALGTVVSPTLLAAIQPGNSQHVFDYINSLPTLDPNSPLGVAFSTLGLLSVDAINPALNAMSPAGFGTFEWMNLTNNAQVLSIFAEHLFELSCSPRACRKYKEKGKRNDFWIEPFGIWSRQKSLGQLTGYHTNGAGLVMGYDRCFQHFYVGGGVGYTRTRFHWSNGAALGSIDQGYGALYGSYFNDFFWVDVSTMLGGNFYDTERKISFDAPSHPGASVDETAKSGKAAFQWSSRLGITGDFSKLKAPLQLMADVEYFYHNYGRFSEHGADGLSLDVRSKISNMIRTELALNLSKDFRYGSGCIAPYLRCGWVTKTPLSRSQREASFIGQSTTFTVNTTSHGVNQVAPAAGFKFTSHSGISFLMEGKAELNGRMKNYFANLRLDYPF